MVPAAAEPTVPVVPAAVPASVARWATPVRRFVGAHLVALLPALAAGLVAFGWRALACGLLVTAGGLVGWALWRSIGRRGRLLDPLHLVWLCLLLTAMLPAHLVANGLATSSGVSGQALWPILPAAGLALAGLTWLLGGTTGGRIFPPLIALLLVAGTLGEAITPRLTLTRERAAIGDLLDYERRPLDELNPTPWLLRTPEYSSDARWRTSARAVLIRYTAGLARPERREISMGSVLRDRLPPLEDIITLGHPQPIGQASVAALLAGGLFLFYRGVADVRITMLTLLGAYITLGLAPVPAKITPDGPVWTWAAALGGWGGGERVGWDVGLTFVHYELLAGPILFVAIYLAPLPSLRPLADRWRILYALLLGPAVALAQRYIDTSIGPPAALLIVSLLTPFMDRATRARTLL